MNIAFDAPAAKPKAVNLPKRKILLVDDDPAVRQILLRLLENEDYFVQTAANGAGALALANAAKFDLALLDLTLPVKAGWEILQQLSKKNPGLAIILMTARPDRLFPALAPEVDALLEKPLDFVILFHTIQALLEKPPAPRPERFLGLPAGVPVQAAEFRRAGKHAN